MLKAKWATMPYLLWIIIFVIVPLALVAVFALSNSSGAFTFENILYVGKYGTVFMRSIFLGAVSTLVCIAIGYPMAYFISKISSKHQNVFVMLLMIPMWTSFLLRTYAWMTILEYNGLINRLLVLLGFAKVNMINTPGAVVLGMVYNFLPYMILPIYTVLTKIDSKIIEAAQDLGANKFKVFLRIIFPLSIPGVISGFTMVFVPSVSTFIISKMLGGGSILVIGDLIEMQFLGNTYNPYLGSAISLILMVIILACMGIMNLFDSKQGTADMVI